MNKIAIPCSINGLGYCNAIPDVETLVAKEAQAIVKAIRCHKEAGKEPDMNTYDDVQNARRYLNRQIQDLENTTQYAISQKFHTVDDNPPSDGKELVDRILAGKYEITEDEHTSWHYPYGIRWRDPSKKADMEGFKAAMENFKNAVQKTYDAAAVLTPAEALASLDDLREYADELVHGKKTKK